MPAIIGLWCVAGLVAVAAIAVVAGRWAFGWALIYGASLLISVLGLAAALSHLSMGAPAETLNVGIGLPGIGANFRLDTLSSFFLIVTNLGGAAATVITHVFERDD